MSYQYRNSTQPCAYCGVAFRPYKVNGIYTRHCSQRCGSLGRVGVLYGPRQGSVAYQCMMHLYRAGQSGLTSKELDLLMGLAKGKGKASHSLWNQVDNGLLRRGLEECRGVAGVNRYWLTDKGRAFLEQHGMIPSYVATPSGQLIHLTE